MYLITTSGQSIGKKLVKTRIIREDGSPVDFVSGVVLRAWIIGFVSMIPFVGGIVALVALSILLPMLTMSSIAS